MNFRPLLPLFLLFLIPAFQVALFFLLGPEPIADLFTPQFLFNNDNYRGFPKLWAVKDALLHDQLPLWNRFEGGGIDIFAIAGVRFFGLILLQFLSPMETVVLLGSLQTFFFLLFFYLLTRQLALSPYAAVLGAMVWTYSGYHVWNLYDLTLTGTDLWLPFLILCYLRSQQSRNPLLWIGVGAAAFGLQALNARPSDFVYNLIFFGGFTLFHLTQGRLELPGNIRQVGRWFFTNSVMLCLGLALAAVLIIPLADYIVGSHRFTSHAHWIPTNYSAFSRIPELFLPNLVASTGSLFIGLVNVPLLFMAQWHPNQPLRRFSWLMAALATLCIFPFGLFDLLRLVPPHQGALVGFRFFPALLLALGILTAMGFDALLQHRKQVPESAINTLFKHYPVRWGGALFIILLAGVFFKPTFWSALVVAGTALAALLLCHISLVRQNKTGLFPLLALALMVGYYVANQGDRSDGPPAERFHEFFDPSTHSELVAFFQEKLNHSSFRVYSFPNALRYPSQLVNYGIPTIFNYEASQPQRIRDIQEEMTRGVLPFAFFDIGSVRYLIGRQGTGDGAPPAWALKRYRVVARLDETFVVLENPTALPRAYFAEAVQVIPEQAEQMRWLRWQLDGMGRTVMLDHHPTCPDNPTLSGEGQVTIVEDSPNRIVLKTQRKKAALLVFSDTHAPGWKAEISGRSTPVFRANYNYRAVCLPAGDQEVVFNYRPDKLTQGAEVSLLAGGVLLFLFTVSAWVGLKKQPDPLDASR
ncbi:MAG: YfhO family protein [Magnetococcales bacterium]|nr:YfhO family protein [Magnetococcales bacterium]